MRLLFSKQRFAGNRTYQPGEVAEVDDEVAAQIVKEAAASVTDEDATVFEAASAPAQDAPKDPPAQDPPKDPPKPKK